MPDIGTESIDAAISREIAGKRRGVGGAVASDIEGASTAWIPDGDVATAQRRMGCEPQAGAEVVEAGRAQSAQASAEARAAVV